MAEVAAEVGSLFSQGSGKNLNFSLQRDPLSEFIQIREGELAAGFGTGICDHR